MAFTPAGAAAGFAAARALERTGLRRAETAGRRTARRATRFATERVRFAGAPRAFVLARDWTRFRTAIAPPLGPSCPESSFEHASRAGVQARRRSALLDARLRAPGNPLPPGS